MSQVLLFEDHPPIRGILKLNAVSLLGIDLIEKETTKEALEYIKSNPGIDLIVCRDGVSGSAEVLKILEEGSLDIPLIWIGHISTSYKYIIMLSKDVVWEEVLSVIGSVLGIDISQKNIEREGEYEAVDCHYFLHISLDKLGVDVYLKLKKDGQDHFVKCLHHIDSFTINDIEKYINSGLKELYIPKNQFAKFVDYATEEFKTKLNEEKIQGEERIAITADAYKITMSRIQSLGVDVNTVAIAEASIKSMKSSIKESEALKSFLKLINRMPYAYANAYLTCLMCHKVADKFDWITSTMREKFTYVAYFHNCSLKDEKLMKIISAEQVEETMLSIAERDVIFGHAHLSALLVEGINKVPEGVSTIIKEHHGSKNGFGFPKTLSMNISAMSMIFIVVEDFVDSFLMVSDKPTVEDYKKIYAKLSARYTSGTYLQALNALNVLVFEMKI